MVLVCMCVAGFLVLRFRKFVGCGCTCQGASGVRNWIGLREGRSENKNVGKANNFLEHLGEYSEAIVRHCGHCGY